MTANRASSGSDMSWDRRKDDGQEGSQSRPDDGPPLLRRHEPLLHEEYEQTGVALPFPSRPAWPGRGRRILRVGGRDGRGSLKMRSVAVRLRLSQLMSEPEPGPEPQRPSGVPNEAGPGSTPKVRRPALGPRRPAPHRRAAPAQHPSADGRMDGPSGSEQRLVALPAPAAGHRPGRGEGPMYMAQLDPGAHRASGPPDGDRGCLGRLQEVEPGGHAGARPERTEVPGGVL